MKTVTSSGTATVETVPGRQGPLTVYRLDGGATPDQAYVLVRFGDELHRAAAKLEESEKVFQSLWHRASAAPQRVEVTEGVNSLFGHRVRLRMGQELVARLDRGPANITSTLLPASLGRVLQLVSATEESVGDVTAQVFRFKPLTPGWADVEFNSGVGDTVSGHAEIRVKVE